MNCLVLHMSSILKCYKGGSRLEYEQLGREDGWFEGDPVMVVVGKEKKEYLVDPIVLQESAFCDLIHCTRTTTTSTRSIANVDEVQYLRSSRENRVIVLDVDSILFEHLLWLVQNDWSSLLKLNLREIIDFYVQDY